MDDQSKGHHLDFVANETFRQALNDGTHGELLAHLFAGGGVTLDADTGKVALLPLDFIKQLTDGAE